MAEPRSPWRRAFGPLTLGLLAGFTISGTLALVFADHSNVVIGVGAFLLSLALIVLLCAIFLAIGYGEDDERRGR